VKPAPIFKYHGLGNDFIVVRAADMPDGLDFGAHGNDRSSRADMTWAKAICDRHHGVGADGVLVLSEHDSQADACMTIYNRDGSRPEMCGNGVRCVVRHLVQVEGVSADSVNIWSDAGLRRCEVTNSNEGTWKVRVDMGQAAMSSQPIRVHLDHDQRGQFDAELTAVDMGNPHAVVFRSANVETLDEVGQALNADHPSFSDGVNVEFVEKTGPNQLCVDVYERGVGRTMACGTGACAAAAAAFEAGVCDPSEPVEVTLPGGALRVELVDGQLWMTGPVDYVFGGELSSDWLAANKL
jgi:diaminopimelate epimerase